MQAVDFLLVRKSQLLREIKSIGLLYSVFIAILIVVFLIFFYKVQVSFQKISFSGLFLLLVITAIHFSRKDHRFIEIIAARPYRIYAAEYILLLIPFVLLSWLAFGLPVLMLIILPVVLICSMKIKSRQMYTFRFAGWMVNDKNFEWKAGIRKSGVALVILWLVSLALTPVPFAPVIALWFFMLVISTFYDDGEPREMLEAYELDANKFLIRKLKEQILTFLIPVIPVLLVSFLFFPDRWWVLLLFLVFGSINIGVFVFSKYAVWRPGETNRSVSIINTICMAGFFLPFLLPVPVVFLFRNYRKSLHNLNPLLNDFH